MHTNDGKSTDGIRPHLAYITSSLVHLPRVYGVTWIRDHAHRQLSEAIHVGLVFGEKKKGRNQDPGNGPMGD